MAPTILPRKSGAPDVLNADRSWPQPLRAAATIFLGGFVVGCFLNPNPFGASVSVDDITAVQFVGTVAHNLRIVGILVVGSLVLAIPTVLVAAWNGLQFGALFVGLEPSSLRIPLLVHGIPESLGQIAATTAGLGLTSQIVRRLTQDRPFSLLPILRWILVAVVLTVLAGTLESTVTPVIALELL